MGSGRKETEIKLAVSDVAAVRRRLRKRGFRVSQPRSLEENTLFDSRARTLQRSGCMLRLRSVRGRHWVTFKGPAGHHHHYKIRQEAETEVADGQAARTILAGLGCQPGFRYQKYRTVYTAPGSWSGGEVMVDETPIGNFVELEGKPAWIRRVARELGAQPRQFITKDYGALYADWCRRHRRPRTHMIFRRKRSLSA